MREGIHPNYYQAKVVCNCGNEFVTGSTKASITLKSVPSAIHSIQASRRQLQLVDVLISSIRSTVCRTTSNSGRQGCGLVELYRFTTFFTITRKLF